MLGSVTTSPVRRSMAIIYRPWSSRLRWTFCTVAIILALAFTWLSLDGGRNNTQGIIEGPAGPHSIDAPLASGHMMLSGWELGRHPSHLGSAGAPRNLVGTRSDSAAALALGSAGALTLTGLVVLLARKFRCSPPEVREQKRRLWKVVRGAQSV